MITDSFFALACGGLIALLFGMLVCFGGYRLFLLLLPIWSFFFGFTLGAHAVQAITPGVGFLVTITSWVAGFFAAAVFAVLSYLFYFMAVAIVAGSLGYGLTVGILMALGVDMNFLVWLIGLIVGIALAVTVIRFNIQKIVIELATAFGGAGMIIVVFVSLFLDEQARALLFASQNPAKLVLQASPFWLIVFIILGVAGFLIQWQHNKVWTVAEYNRLEVEIPT